MVGDVDREETHVSNVRVSRRGTSRGRVSVQNRGRGLGGVFSRNVSFLGLAFFYISLASGRYVTALEDFRLVNSTNCASWYTFGRASKRYKRSDRFESGVDLSFPRGCALCYEGFVTGDGGVLRSGQPTPPAHPLVRYCVGESFASSCSIRNLKPVVLE